MLAGDLRANQDSNITTERAQTERSGYAPETVVYGYGLEGGSFAFETAVDHILDRSHLPLITTNSWGITMAINPFHDCDGDWDEDEAINWMYEAGILSFVLAGNEKVVVPDECDIWIPGSALSAFTVGGHMSQKNAGISQLRTGPLWYRTGYGLDDNGRDVVELTAPMGQYKLPGGDAGGVAQYNVTQEGTSFSTPMVAAAALDFADFYETTYSTWIRNPGALFSSMLLMGDRQTVSGKTDSGFDPEWGGRMLMRMFNAAGMDAPWYYGRFSVCVDDGEEVTYDMAGVPADVDNLIAVAHWYDRRHDFSGNTLDDIDLKVEISTNGVVVNSRTSQSSENNKERVHFPMNTLSNHAYNVRLILKGYDVTASNEGCGDGSIGSTKVFISWYYEDNDRDDSNGPGAEILPQ